MAAHQENQSASAPGAAGRDIYQFAIEGMTCASCVRRVEQSIARTPGVAAATVNLATERADVSFSAAPDIPAAVKAIESAGYAVPQDTIELSIHGMTCASCVARVEKKLRAVPGVTVASVNLATERGTVRFARGAVPASALEQAVREAGYEARRIGSEDTSDRERDARAAETKALGRSMTFAALLTLPVFVLEMGSHFVPAIHDLVMATIGMRQSWIIQFVLATLVLFGPGLRFFRKGVPALLRGRPT